MEIAYKNKGRMQMRYINLRDTKAWNERAAEWFHEKWSVPVETYMESIIACQEAKASVPQWYIIVEGEKIIAGCGVIQNDFHKRKDLSPNVCAVYVEEAYRHQNISRGMLNYVCKDMKAMGVETLYLITEHTSFYEKCGWQFLEMIEEDNGHMTRMYTHKQE